jgi:hypothetical protein
MDPQIARIFTAKWRLMQTAILVQLSVGLSKMGSIASFAIRMTAKLLINPVGMWREAASAGMVKPAVFLVVLLNTQPQIVIPLV